MIIFFNPSLTLSIGLVISVGVVVHEVKKNAIIVIVAKNIKVGDVCMKDDKTYVTIVSIKEYSDSHTVYNLLSVSENHNFFANKILVHNK